MSNLCGQCGSRVPYFGRRFAYHRWFCSDACREIWTAARARGEPEPEIPERRARRVHWFIRVLTVIGGIAFLFVIGSCLVVVAALVFYDRASFPAGADNTAEADVRNGQIMASLPVPAGGVLIEKDIWDEWCCHPLERFRYLTHVYATEATMDEVVAFYRQRLAQGGGWEYDGVGTAGHWFHNEDVQVFITPLAKPAATFSFSSSLERVSFKSIAEPPATASVFFAVTSSLRLDCLGLGSCYELDE
jgi:hypothetical protein